MPHEDTPRETETMLITLDSAHRDDGTANAFTVDIPLISNVQSMEVVEARVTNTFRDVIAGMTFDTVRGDTITLPTADPYTREFNGDQLAAYMNAAFVASTGLTVSYDALACQFIMTNTSAVADGIDQSSVSANARAHLGIVGDVASSDTTIANGQQWPFGLPANLRVEETYVLLDIAHANVMSGSIGGAARTTAKISTDNYDAFSVVASEPMIFRGAKRLARFECSLYRRSGELYDLAGSSWSITIRVVHSL